jgi:hypothetical protein
MTRSKNFSAVGVGGFCMAATLATMLAGCPSGGVGDPCVPEDEYKENFSGFKVTEENIESRSFQCQTRICLVNHFQGRVSCPNGQGAPVTCSGPNDNSCTGGQTCTQSVVANPCTAQTECPVTGGYVCEGGYCKVFVCSTPDDPNRCYIPGTQTPVAVPVCPQCSEGSARDAADSVYCSCRCGVAEGEEEDPGFNYCTCDKGFVCAEVRKNVGLGDVLLTGKYCVKENTVYKDANECGQLLATPYSTTACSGSSPI